jgi:hypothetical protein
METASTQADPEVMNRSMLMKRGALIPVLFATLLGGFVRLAPVLSSDFPLNDGGLFYVFVQEIQASHYQLPLVSNYNQAFIPFLYPPLSFYLTGLLSTLTGISLLDLIRFLPSLISILTIPAIYLLARELLKSRLPAAIATVSYALLPTAFDFMIVGGGLPRAFGFIFCILTLYQAARLYTSGTRSRLVTTAIFATLTVLSHPVVAWFMVYSLAILFLFLGASRRGLADSLLVAAIVLLLTAPWWGVNVARHGLGSFLSPFQAGTRSWTALLAPFLFLQTNEPYLTFQAVFALLGFFFSLRSRHFLVPAWLAAVFLIETRLTATYAVIPTALLVGIGIERVVLPGLAGGRDDSPQADSATAMDRNRTVLAGGVLGVPWAGGWAAKLAMGYLLLYLLTAAFLAAPHEALPQSQRKAMEWIRASTPPTSRFAVISGIGPAGTDYVSEWFPALTDRTSLATPQGYEWFPDEVYDRRWNLHSALQVCIEQEARCLEDWAERAQSPYTHVYLVRHLPVAGDDGTPAELYNSLLSSPKYVQIFNQEDVAIFAYLPAQLLSP